MLSESVAAGGQPQSYAAQTHGRTRMYFRPAGRYPSNHGPDRGLKVC